MFHQARFTFATVVFEPEKELLDVQARSFAAHLRSDEVAKILVIDNTARGLGRRDRERFARAYGPLAPLVEITRLPEVAALQGQHGWRRQQIAKLTVSRMVDTPFYITLDAKNHFIRDITLADFFASDGRARSGWHSYEHHPLAEELRHTLAELGADSAAIESAVAWFPVTATPFVLSTSETRGLIAAVGGSDEEFSREFARRGFLEFFLYSGWLEFHSVGFGALYVADPIQAPTLWPGAVDQAKVAATLAHADAIDAPLLGVHRRSLAAAAPETLDLLTAFWVSHGVFADSATASRLIGHFRRRFTARLARARLSERLHSTLDSVRGQRRWG